MTIYDEGCYGIVKLDVGEGIAKWIYFFGFLLTQIAAWMLRDYAEGLKCHTNLRYSLQEGLLFFEKKNVTKT